MDGGDVNVFLCKYLCNINQQSCAVVPKDPDIRNEQIVFMLLEVLRLPLRIYEPHLLGFLKVHDVDTVGPVDGHSPASGNKAHYLITRHRRTAL